tara:strand:+ start:5421 stop:5789 length:369 start_codon:yes stop_codon:yes gene_type:complete
MYACASASGDPRVPIFTMGASTAALTTIDARARVAHLARFLNCLTFVAVLEEIDARLVTALMMFVPVPVDREWIDRSAFERFHRAFDVARARDRPRRVARARRFERAPSRARRSHRRRSRAS